MKAIKRGRAAAFLAGVMVLAIIGMAHAAFGSTNADSGQKPLQYTAGGHVLGFDADRMYAASGSHMLRVQFVGSTGCTPVAEGGGADEKGKALPLTRVEYPGLWRNVSLVYEAKAGSVLKSTYYVAPGGRPEDIRLKYNGPVQVASNGGLEVGLQVGSFREAAPIAWQEKDGKRISVPVKFKKVSDIEAGFEIGLYDKTLPLVIDPELSWNTFLGGGSNDEVYEVAVDGSGNVYVVGTSYAAWGTPVRAYSGGSSDAFAAKLADNGTLIWNTFLGGSSTDDGYGIAVDNSGNVYVAGGSWVTWGAPVRAYSGGKEAFVARLADNGTLIWNTFLGSSSADTGSGIAVDDSGNVYVAGQSSAAWGSPVWPSGGAFVAKLADNGTLIWNTFLGSTSDYSSAIAVDGSGKVYVAGNSFATWGTPVRLYSGGSSDAFAAKLADNGTLIWNTFLGGTLSDSCNAIAVDGSGNVYVAGTSYATWGSPVRAYSGGSYDAFAAQLDSSGALMWGTFLGSGNGNALALDGNHSVYVAGWSSGTWGTPLQAYSGGQDAFAARLADTGPLVWNTFLGGSANEAGCGIAISTSSNMYVAGISSATWGSPVRPYSASLDTFVAKVNIGPSPAKMTVKGNNTVIADNDTTPSTADHTDFGGAGVTGHTVVRTFTIENIGDLDLNLTGSPKVSITGANADDFSVTAEPEATVAPHASTTFQVTFAPSAFFERAAEISIANDDSHQNPYNFAIQGTGICEYIFSSSSVSLTSAEGTGSFDMTTHSSCVWSAEDNASWIDITSSDCGTGSTTVDYSVAANPGIARSGAITIGDQKFTVSQASGCTVSINPESAWHNGLAGSYEIGIMASDSSCPWGAHSNDSSWITITSDNGTGNGTVYYNIAEYFIASGGSTTRTGTISAAGQMFTVTQTAHFAVSGDSTTVSDNVTGLEWCRNASLGNSLYAWQAALDAIEDLNEANGGTGTYGHNDWRLPTKEELVSLLDNGTSNPALPAGHPFTGVKNNLYWTSSTHLLFSGSAWGVHLGTGDDTGYYDKEDSTLYVWPVRCNNTGPFRTLRVLKSGAGTGTVKNMPYDQAQEEANMQNVLCAPVCFTAFPEMMTVKLEATAGTWMRFDGWQGCDNVTSDNECIVDMHEAREVTAVFSDVSAKHRAIIVAGSGTYAENNLWDATQNLVNAAHDILGEQGYTDDRIYYLTFPVNSVWDSGSDNESGLYQLEKAVTQWAADADSLVIYLMGHGVPGQFEINGLTDEFLQADVLAGWLDELQAVRNIPVIVIYEGCYSGSFLGYLAPGAGLEDRVRIVISSADTDEKAWFANNGAVSFSQYFWSGVQDGRTVDVCFADGLEGMQIPGYQTARMDADGDNDTDTTDETIASQYVIGRGMVPGGLMPVIGTIMGEQRLYAGDNDSDIWVSNIVPTPSLVWAVIRRPSDGAQTDPRAITDLLTENLSKVGMTDEYRKTGSSVFGASGVYTVSVYAWDGDKISMPKITKVIKDVDEYEDDDAPAQAKPVVVNQKQPQYHNFMEDEDEDWVKFYGMPGATGSQQYTFFVYDLAPQCDAAAELYGPDNSSKYITDININSVTDWFCTTEGIYYVKIYQSSGTNYGNFTNYHLRVWNFDAPVLGVIKGSITSGSGGGAISNAVITTDGGFSAISSSGAYEMPHEGGGPYALTANASGYQTYTHSGINLESRQTLVLNIVMTPIGGTSTTTTVSTNGSTTTTVSETGTTTSVAATTTTTTVKRKCTVRKTLGEGHETELELVRKFRDTRLSSTADGAQLVALYYRHSDELTMIFEKRSDIEAEVRELILELLPQIGCRQKFHLTNDMKQRMYLLIGSINAEASPGLKKSLRLVCKKIEKGELPEQ